MGILKSIKKLFRSDIAKAGLADLVKAAEGTELGANVAQVVRIAEASGQTGPQKLAQALPLVVEAIGSTAARGGFSAVAADAETFARLLIENELAKLKTTGLLALAQAVLGVFGVKL